MGQTNSTLSLPSHGDNSTNCLFLSGNHAPGNKTFITSGRTVLNIPPPNNFTEGFLNFPHQISSILHNDPRAAIKLESTLRQQSLCTYCRKLGYYSKLCQLSEGSQHKLCCKSTESAELDPISSPSRQPSTRSAIETSSSNQISVEDGNSSTENPMNCAIKWGPLQGQPRAHFGQSTWNKEAFPFARWPSKYVFQRKNGKKCMPFAKYPSLAAFQANNSNPFMEFPSITVFESGHIIDGTTLIRSLFEGNRKGHHVQSSRCPLKRQPRTVYTRSDLIHAEGFANLARERLSTSESYRGRSQRQASRPAPHPTNTQACAFRSPTQTLGSPRRVTFASPLSVIHESPVSEDEDPISSNTSGLRLRGVSGLLRRRGSLELLNQKAHKPKLMKRFLNKVLAMKSRVEIEWRPILGLNNDYSQIAAMNDQSESVSFNEQLSPKSKSDMDENSSTTTQHSGNLQSVSSTRVKYRMENINEWLHEGYGYGASEEREGVNANDEVEIQDEKRHFWSICSDDV